MCIGGKDKYILAIILTNHSTWVYKYNSCLINKIICIHNRLIFMYQIELIKKKKNGYLAQTSFEMLGVFSVLWYLSFNRDAIHNTTLFLAFTMMYVT